MSNEPLMRQAKLIPKGPPRIIYIYTCCAYVVVYIYNISLYVIYIFCVQATVPNMQDEHLTFVSFGRWQETILMDSFDLDSDGKAK